MSEIKELASKSLGLHSDIEGIQEAIDVILELVPAENTEHDSRILRALVTLNHMKCSLQKQKDEEVQET